jgi:hypothetical protein
MPMSDSPDSTRAITLSTSLSARRTSMSGNFVR